MAPLSGYISRLLAHALIIPVRFYQLCISPMFPGSCRFTPTCSQYAVEALRLHGPVKGLWLALRRLSRCHPWGGSGYDPVPPPSGHNTATGAPLAIDIHTHLTHPHDFLHTSQSSQSSQISNSSQPPRIISVSTDEFEGIPGDFPGWFSVGLHPWHTETIPTRWKSTLEGQLADPRVVAIGECGLDTTRGAAIDTQTRIFNEQIHLSETYGKPLVIHLVKALDTFLKIRKESTGNQPWIIHGFRGKPQMLSQLLSSKGSNPLYFSIGERFNPATVANIPTDRLLIETDESTSHITDILDRVAHARGESPGRLASTVNANALRLFPQLAPLLNEKAATRQ